MRPEMTERMRKLVEEMRTEGTLVDTGGRSNELMELRLTHKNGRTTVIDGSFSESKEVVGFLETFGEDANCYLHEVYSAPE